MIDPKIFGERIKRARRATRLTQKALGEIIGVGENAVHQIERGNNWPSLPSTVLLANRLGLSLDWLCGREDAHPLVKGGERVENEERLAQQVALLEAEIVQLQASFLGLVRIMSRRTGALGPELLSEHRALVDGLAARRHPGRPEDTVARGPAGWEDLLDPP